MSDARDMQYDPIQGQGHEPFKVGNPAIFKSYLLSRLQWELAADHVFLNYDTISKFDRFKFLIFGLVFVSRDIEVGTNVSCEESTVSPRTGLIFIIIITLATSSGKCNVMVWRPSMCLSHWHTYCDSPGGQHVMRSAYISAQLYGGPTYSLRRSW